MYVGEIEWRCYVKSENVLVHAVVDAGCILSMQENIPTKSANHDYLKKLFGVFGEVLYIRWAELTARINNPSVVL